MNNPSALASDNEHPPEIALADVLPLAHVLLDIELGSRKKLLQQLSDVVSETQTDLTSDSVFKLLVERERLGSTAIGHGIALPHARVEGLGAPVMAVIRLLHSIDYDSPDEKPVWLAVGLVVPSDANQTHLQLLARLASRFQDNGFLEDVRTASTSEQVHQQFLSI